MKKVVKTLEPTEGEQIEFLSKEIPIKTVSLARPYNARNGYDTMDKLEYKNDKWNIGANEFECKKDVAWFLIRNAYVMFENSSIPTQKQSEIKWVAEYGIFNEPGRIAKGAMESREKKRKRYIY